MERKRLIFIVDDDPLINTLVEKKFTREGYTVQAFETGEEFIDVLNSDPGLIILDYLFNGESQKYSNGMEIFDRIRELKPDIPVIMLSGQESGELVLEFARKGIKDYIVKDSALIDNLTIAINEVFDEEI